MAAASTSRGSPSAGNWEMLAENMNRSKRDRSTSSEDEEEGLARSPSESTSSGASNGELNHGSNGFGQDVMTAPEEPSPAVANAVVAEEGEGGGSSSASSSSGSKSKKSLNQPLRLAVAARKTVPRKRADSNDEDRLARFVPIGDINGTNSRSVSRSDSPVQYWYPGHQILHELKAVPMLVDLLDYAVQKHKIAVESKRVLDRAYGFVARSVLGVISAAKNVVNGADKTRRECTPDFILKISDKIEGRVWRALRRGDIFVARKISAGVNYLYFLKRPRPEIKTSLKKFLRDRERDFVKRIKASFLIDNSVVKKTSEVAGKMRSTVLFWREESSAHAQRVG